MTGSAVFSDCRRYRYCLERNLGGSGPVIAFLLHNPSTADEGREDATSRRGVDFARRWGGSRLIYINLWAGIATVPKDLWAMPDPVGPENDRHISQVGVTVAQSGGFVIYAWGAIKPPAHRRAEATARLIAVESLIRACGCSVRALGVNLDGSPKHPLYVRSDAAPRSWPQACDVTTPDDEALIFRDACVEGKLAISREARQEGVTAELAMLGSNMLSAQNILRLQREQYRHDQRNHFDILSLGKVDRLKHYGLHFAKYVGRLARGSDEPKMVEQTMIDTVLICLSAANALHQKLYELPFEDRRIGDQIDYLRPFADASGRFADACEKIDHLEHFLPLALDANRDIMSWTIAFSLERNVDIMLGIQNRRRQLADRAFFIEG